MPIRLPEQTPTILTTGVTRETDAHYAAAPLAHEGTNAAENANRPSILGAAFRQENDIVALWDYITAETARPFDPQFDFGAAAAGSDLYRQYPDKFDEVNDETEFRELERRLAIELADREVLAGSGVGGFLASMLAGTISPTILLPASTALKGSSAVYRIANTAGWVAGGALLQEMALQTDQEFRTTDESATGVLSAAILGAAFGGAASFLRRGEREEVDQLFREGMDETRTVQVIPNAAGAQVNPIPLGEYAGRLEAGLGTNKALSWLFPTVRQIEQKISDSASHVMALIDTGGLRYARNVDGIAAAAGGDVVSRQRQWYGHSAQALRVMRSIYGEYKRATPQAASKAQFWEEVSWAIDRGVAPNAFITRAAEAYGKMFKKFADEAIALKMPGFENLSEDFMKKYIHRMPNPHKLLAQRVDAQTILTEHFNEILQESFNKRMLRATERKASDDAAADLVDIAPEDFHRMYSETTAEVNSVPNTAFERAGLTNEFEYYNNLRARRKVLGKEFRAKTQDEFDAIRETLAETRKLIAKERAPLNARLRALRASRGGIEAEKLIVAEKLLRVEETQIKFLEDFAKKVEKLNKQIGKITPRTATKNINALIKEIKGLMQYMSGNNFGDLDDLVDLHSLLEGLKKAAPEARKLELQKVIAATKQATLKKISDKEIKAVELRNKLGRLDPETSKAVAAGLRRKGAERLNSILETARGRGGKIDGQSVDFSSVAKLRADQLLEKMLGEGNRAPAIALLGERGPELQRTLGIDIDRVWSNGRTWGEFLERDIEYIAAAYTKAMSGDIELFRKFGTVNPAKGGDDAPNIIQAVGREFQAAIDEAAKMPAGKERERLLVNIASAKKDFERDLTGVVDRVRGTRGSPKDPLSIIYRGGKVAREMNVLRMMGNVVVSSFADVARPVMRYGLLNTFRDGFIPMVKNFKQFKLGLYEAQLTGTALDMLQHGRLAAWADTADV